MKYRFKIFTFLLLLVAASTYGQLGFCTGSKGEPVFSENFGNGTTYGPALPAGTTNYNFVVGSPDDGSYTLFYRTNLYSTWHYSLDHTPDAMNGINGKALIVNANASTSGDFYRRTVTGLCINTTFEFSAWVMNVYNPGSGFCGANEIPINVRFEIWNDNETVLLGSGNTGNIMGTFAPTWQQYALVFTTGSETSVVLKMKNNGLGGCGNDLAIDDIEFRACGDLTSISSSATTGAVYEVCEDQGPVAITLQATTAGTSTYFYQWQTSNDGASWTDIPGANTPSYTSPNLSTLTYFRAKAAQDATNLSNSFCSTVSNFFTVSFINAPPNAVSNGDVMVCSNETIPPITVTVDATSSVNWYDAASGGNLLLTNSISYTPTTAGTYYAEVYDLTSNCINQSRTPVTLTIVPLPTVTISGTTSICEGNAAVITFNGTPNAIVAYTIDGGANQTINLDSNGLASLPTGVLTTTTTYHLVSCTSSELTSCSAVVIGSAVVTVNASPTVSISAPVVVCNGSDGAITFVGTPNATVFYTINNGSNQTVLLNATGEAVVTLLNITSSTLVSLVNVTSTGINSCTQNVSQSLTISISPQPMATISASPQAVCSGQTSTLTFNGTPTALVIYTVNGGANQTVNLNASGLAVVTTASVNANTTFQLVSVELNDCSQTLSDFVIVTINPTPVASFTGSLNYCSGEPLAITLASTIPGTNFTWTVTQNGTTGASAGSGNQINQVVTEGQTDGTVTYVVTPMYNGCSGNSLLITVVIHTNPNPTPMDGAICLDSGNTSYYTLNTNLTTANYSFIWLYENAVISNANGSTYNAYQTGTYSVIATNLITGCVSAVVNAEVNEAATGESLLIQQSAAFSDNPTITVTVVGGQGPFLYQLDGNGFQTSNVFTNVSAGTHVITVVDENFCTNLTDTVTIINYPRFFTPNGDSVHDTWNIKGVGANSQILIFDRYGKLLKQLSTSGPGWDGTYNGQPLFSSDYWFVIDYLENGIPKTFKAHFSLKR